MTPGREGGCGRWNAGRKERKQIKPGQGVTRVPRASRNPAAVAAAAAGGGPGRAGPAELETTIQGGTCRRGRKRPEAQRKSDSPCVPEALRGPGSRGGGLADPPSPPQVLRGRIPGPPLWRLIQPSCERELLALDLGGRGVSCGWASEVG